jgi:type I restriction-modification system DNA methylase subunit
VSKDFKICEPAVGTGGFLIAAYEWLKAEAKGGALDRDTAKRICTQTYYGNELVARPRRLALMNLYLHRVEPHITFGDSLPRLTSTSVTSGRCCSKHRRASALVDATPTTLMPPCPSRWRAASTKSALSSTIRQRIVYLSST